MTKLSIIIFDYIQIFSEKLSILYMSVWSNCLSQATNIYLLFIMPLICIQLSFCRPTESRKTSSSSEAAQFPHIVIRGLGVIRKEYIFNNFLIRSPIFLFCNRPCILCSQFWTYVFKCKLREGKTVSVYSLASSIVPSTRKGQNMYVLNEQGQEKGCREERPGPPSSQAGTGPPPLEFWRELYNSAYQSLSENENSYTDKLKEQASTWN